MQGCRWMPAATIKTKIMTEEIEMLQIKDTLVSLDVVERFFICDLDKCLGECCIEGDAGAPITKEEYEKLKEIVPVERLDASSSQGDRGAGCGLHR